MHERVRWQLASVGVAAAVAFALLAALVAHGTATPLDRYAIDHWMPWLERSSGQGTLRSLIVPATRGSLAGTVAGLWTYPASPLVSAALLVPAALRLVQRGRQREALGWYAAWLVASALAQAGKTAVHRPHLYHIVINHHERIDITGLQHSFPSGHTARACILAAAVASAWPHLRGLATGWALVVPVALVALGDHTPTDVVGGVLLATALIAGDHLASPPLRPTTTETFRRSYPRGSS
jgi:membrane-associated phospholipid phosphatase